MQDKNKLFLTSSESDKKEYCRLIQAAAEKVAASLTDSKAYSGMPPDELRKVIRGGEILPEQGLGFDDVLEETAEKILPYLVRPASPDYMPHLHSAPLLETIAAELIIASFNQSMDTWDQAPAATEVEVDVIEKLCRLYGYDEKSDGVFTSGGSQSNLSGLLLARDWFCNTKLQHDVKKFGLPESFRKFRMYSSEIAHFSIEKSAHLMGLGYGAVVKVPVDSAMKMDVAALRRLIQEDLEQGNLPFCCVATIGTTDFGSIDPLNGIRAVCDEFGIWLHGDAAYGSGVILSEKYRNRVNGLALCDSITVDFHKMFMMPISCSASLIRDKRQFDTMTLHSDYLNREEDEEDEYTNLVNKSMQVTRRFDALKVWMSFRMRGKDGWSDIISTCIENAAYLYGKLKASPDFEPVVEPEISSVVFRVLPEKGAKESADDMNRRIRRTLMLKKGVVIGQTVCQGQVCLKFTLLNPTQSHENLDSLLELILSLRRG